MKKIKIILQTLRLCLIAVFVEWDNKKFILDMERWKRIYNINGSKYHVLSRLMWDYPEFRNLYLYRNSKRILYRTWVKLVYPPVNTLFLEAGEIGGGLFIQHGFSTIVAAKSIGENCWINQQVTIGYTGDGSPVIGNNVMITCGAKVLGKIIVGDNVIVGANAVVIHNIEANSVVGGVPAHKLK